MGIGTIRDGSVKLSCPRCHSSNWFKLDPKIQNGDFRGSVTQMFRCPDCMHMFKATFKKKPIQEGVKFERGIGGD